MNLRTLTFAVLSTLVAMPAATAAAWLDAEQAAFSPNTRGGSVPGTTIYTVTSLETEGPGTLAEALEQRGPKIIIFEVGGVIELDGDLEIDTANTTIAGETAPSPGITLNGAGLRIRSHDIIVRHIAVRAAPSDDPETNGSLDTLSIGGNPERYGSAIRNVLIENVSVSWGVDENLSVWDENTGNVQLRSLIISEALNDAGHPEGTHSKGMLVGSGIDTVSITDSFFAHNVDRQPRISPDAQVSAERNLIYNPVQVGMEIFVECHVVEPPRRIAKMVLVPGPDTYDDVELYNFNNYDVDIDEYADPNCEHGWDSLSFEEATEQEAEDVVASVVAHAGARPADRNRTDVRVISEFQSGGGQIRDRPTGETTAGNGRRYFQMPSEALSTTGNGHLVIDGALCRAHLALGGLPSTTCR